jgi:hypothetical protein
MSSGSGETIVFNNRFGEITNKRLVYFAKKGWFSGKSREDIPLKQVVSVRQETGRNIFSGLIWTVFGLILLVGVIGIVPLIYGILLLWGSPTVFVVTAGGTATRSVAFPWESKDAEEFVDALRNELFKD